MKAKEFVKQYFPNAFAEKINTKISHYFIVWSDLSRETRLGSGKNKNNAWVNAREVLK